MDCILHGVAKSQTQLSGFHFHFQMIQDKFLISQFLTFITSIKFHFHVVAQIIKKLLATQETWVRFLGQEGSLEKEMATHSSTLAWRIPWTVEPGRLQSMGGKDPDRTEQLTHFSLHTTDLQVSGTVMYKP